MLVESVPNYSEGRRLDVVDRLAAAVEGTPGAHLLDRTSDASHNRSVLTLAGEAPAVAAALERTLQVAIEQIDMERHSGEHPRIGAVDVVPFVPLGSTTMDDAIDLARGFGARVAERFDIPVYLYARAATRPERVRLADVRRGGYEGVRNDLLAGVAERAPDFGPSRAHARAGAVAVGARPFLIAWNINLDTNDVEVAKRIARRVRESGGGLAAVQGNGFFIEGLDAAQVSMNLLDFETTPMWRVWDEVARLAAEEGVAPKESELIGLAPQAAFDGVAAHAGAGRNPGTAEDADADAAARFDAAARYLRLRDADPMMVLEQRLAAAARADSASR
ncbi:MAG TPA: glutamate formimidoyltransferase [Candidatus Limnocylindrales bacterium]|nr:glutamate formimidoyltransferase [Candidatus Limnocylindrales bacterium]